MPIERQYFEVKIPMAWGYVVGCWYGTPHKRPILALHGWQDNAGTFARLAPLIAPHVPVLAIDLPGHGRSTHYPAGIHYKAMDFVRVIYQILHHYRWPRITLMGHSMGAAISFHFASLFPRMVAGMIVFDTVCTRYFPTDILIAIIHGMVERNIVEDARIIERLQQSSKEPPLYTFEELENMLHRGSEQSVNIENCKYLLERSVKRATSDANKYLLTRDGRVKYLLEFYTEPGLRLEMAKRIRNVNFLVCKAGNSDHIPSQALEVLEVLRKNNPNFEYYEVPNTSHHLHLNNPHEVAKFVIPFVKKYCIEEEREEERKSSSKL